MFLFINYCVETIIARNSFKLKTYYLLHMLRFPNQILACNVIQLLTDKIWPNQYDIHRTILEFAARQVKICCIGGMLSEHDRNGSLNTKRYCFSILVIMKYTVTVIPNMLQYEIKRKEYSNISVESYFNVLFEHWYHIIFL